jgi:metallo-beta-lactamase family protein
VLLIPSFAVGRTQLLLYYLRELKEQRKIPDVPIVIDSPMADDATAIYGRHPSDYDEESLQIARAGRHPFSPSKLFFTKDRQESKKLNSISDPIIIISASGMLSGGRILHHLRQRISSPRNTLLFVGYQPPGGRGAWIKSGATSLRLMGEEFPIRAHIDEVTEFSAHADKAELLRWCEESKGLSGASMPSKVAVVHGEPDSARAFAETLRERFSWNVTVPGYRDEIIL